MNKQWLIAVTALAVVGIGAFALGSWKAGPKAIADGVYTACEVKGTPVHNDASGVRFGGGHLNIPDTVRIQTVGNDKQVTFEHSSAASQNAGLPATLAFTGQPVSDGRIVAEVMLPHVSADGSQKKDIKHQVTIRKVTDQVSGCGSNKTRLGISFCTQFTDANGVAGWECSGTLPHLGDIHVEK